MDNRSPSLRAWTSLAPRRAAGSELVSARRDADDERVAGWPRDDEELSQEPRTQTHRRLPAARSDASRLALEAAGLGTWELDLSTRTVVCDARCRALLDLDGALDVSGTCSLRDELPLRAVLEVFADHERPRILADIRGACDGEGEARYRGDHKVASAKRGDERWLRVHAKLFGLPGQPARYVGTVEDISEQKREERAVLQQLEREQELIGIVSHDLRNPIAAIIVGAQLMGDRARHLDTMLSKTAQRVLMSGERAARLIRDLLDFTQARLTNLLPIEKREANVHKVCRQVLDEVTFNHPDRKVEHHVSGRGDGLWDADRLAQVVGNIVRNALTYSPADSVVTVRSCSDGDEATIAVHNANLDGPIPEHTLATLFEPFSRGERARHVERGVGLGLYIVRELVSAHEGTVEVSSDLQHGTTFRVRLPRA